MSAAGRVYRVLEAMTLVIAGCASTRGEEAAQGLCECLLGDREACRYFKNMPSSSDWNLQARQSETDC